MVDVQSDSPARFGPGNRSRQSPPSPSQAESPSQPQPEIEEEDEEWSPPPRESRGVRDRLNDLRERAWGNRRPLGSPEGRHRRASPSNRSWDSSKEGLFVDALALGVRNVSVWVDWIAGKRFPDKDFIATAEECMNIASPLAGDLLDRIPDTGPLAELVEHAGIAGAGVSTVTYFVRAGTGRPGGRAESEALEEKIVRRLGGARKRVTEKMNEGVENAGEQETEERPSTYASMLHLEDDDFGINATGPV